MLDRLVADGSELGLQVAAFIDGEPVVDAWAGYADPDRTRTIDGQTLFTASSTGKGPAASCVHLLAERGKIDYEAPVCNVLASSSVPTAKPRSPCATCCRTKPVCRTRPRVSTPR